MKVWLDTSSLKERHYQKFIQSFPNVLFITDLKRASEAEVAICSPHLVHKEILDQLPHLKWIQLMSAGYDACDLNYVKHRKLMISYAKDVYSIQIAEDVISKILYFNRNLGIYHEQFKSKTWQNITSKRELFGATIGIIGSGSIGDEIAKRLKPFQTRILGYRRSKITSPFYEAIYHEKEGLEKLLTSSDYVILSVPLTEETYHLISKRELSLMKDTAILINIARGKIIDQDALIEALNANLIGGAALDVTDPEPLPKNHPLWDAKNLFITPHNSAIGPKMHERLFNQLSISLNAYLEGITLDNLITL